MAPPTPAPKFGAPLYCAGWASPEVALVAGGGGKASSGIPNRIIALSVPQGAQAPSSTEAASLPCEATPLRLALEPRIAENSDGPVYAAVALAGGGVARLEVTLSSEGPAAAAAAPSMQFLRPGQKESKPVEAPEEKKPVSSPSPSKMRGAFGSNGNGGSSKKREQQLQQEEKETGGDNNNGGGGNRHSPVGAAGRAVAGLTAAAVGALPRALLRTFSGGNVPASASASSVEVKCLAFSRDASLLACGGEDGIVRLLAWPSLTPVSEVRPASAASSNSSSSNGSGSANNNSDGVRDLDFGPSSTDGGAHLLAVVLDSGDASVWRVGAGVSSAAPLATLPPPPMPVEAAKAAAKAAAARRGGGRAPPPPRPATVARLRFDRAPPPAAVRLLAAVNHPAAGGFLAAAAARATSSPADAGAPPLALSWAPMPALSASDAAASSASFASGGATPPPPPPSPQQQASRRLLPAPPPKKILPSPVTAFDVSPCGKLVGAGSSDGDTAIARADDLGLVASSKGKHMVFVTAVAFAPPSSSPSSSSSALLSVSADASAALTRAPASALLPRRSSSSASCSSCAVARTLARVLTALLTLLVLLLFLAEAAARGSGVAACRAPSISASSSSTPNPLVVLLRSLGLSSSAPPPHRVSAKEHLEAAAARVAVLVSSRCRAAVAERLRAAGPGGLFRGGGGDGEL